MNINEPAFPHDERDCNGQVRQHFGLTNLEAFTKAAMQGLCASDAISKDIANLDTVQDALDLQTGLAQSAIGIAQATLAALEKVQVVTQTKAPPSRGVMAEAPHLDPQELVEALKEMLKHFQVSYGDAQYNTYCNARDTLAKWEAKR